MGGDDAQAAGGRGRRRGRGRSRSGVAAGGETEGVGAGVAAAGTGVRRRARRHRRDDDPGGRFVGLPGGGAELGAVEVARVVFVVVVGQREDGRGARRADRPRPAAGARGEVAGDLDRPHRRRIEGVDARVGRRVRVEDFAVVGRFARIPPLGVGLFPRLFEGDREGADRRLDAPPLFGPGRARASPGRPPRRDRRSPRCSTIPASSPSCRGEGTEGLRRFAVAGDEDHRAGDVAGFRVDHAVPGGEDDVPGASRSRSRSTGNARFAFDRVFAVDGAVGAVRKERRIAGVDAFGRGGRGGRSRTSRPERPRPRQRQHRHRLRRRPPGRRPAGDRRPRRDGEGPRPAARRPRSRRPPRRRGSGRRGRSKGPHRGRSYPTMLTCWRSWTGFWPLP